MFLRKAFLFVLCLFAAGVFVMAEDAKKDAKPAPALEGVVGARHPSFSPDGKKIAFTFKGDIWTVGTEGGRAQRLTLHEAYDVRPYWSPDGKKIAFSSNRNSGWDVWTIDADGGKPEQLTFHFAADLATCWMPNGKSIIVESSRTGDSNAWEVYLDGSTPRQITEYGARMPMISPDGKNIAYTNGVSPLNQRGYKGTANYDLYTVSFAGGIPEMVTTTNINELYPFWSAKSDALYFIAEDEKGVYNINRLDLASKKTEQVTKFDTDVLNPILSSDGKTLSFERDFHIWLMPLSGGEAKPINIDATTDEKAYNFVTQTLTEGAINPEISRDGRTVAFSLAGDIWIMPSSGGMARQLTSGPAYDQWPKFSPDGSRLAFFSNLRGPNNIYIMGANGGEPMPVTDSSQFNSFFHSWSPLGDGMVFTSDRTGNKEIFYMNFNSGEMIQLTNSPSADDDPTFSPDGSLITFDSGRSGNSAIWVMPARGGPARQISSGSGVDQVPGFSADGKMVVFESDRNGRTGLYVVSINGGTEMQISPDGGKPSWSADGRYILFEAERDKHKGIYVMDAPTSILVGRELTVIAETETTKDKFYTQIFEEAWLDLKSGFYDEKMHGLDWDKVKEKYLPLIQAADNREEVTFYISQMIGELKASHMGVYAPNDRRGGEVTGYLGASLSAPDESVSTTGMLVTDVVPNSAADKAWIRKGDYLFAVDGTDLNRGKTNFYKLMNGKPNRDVKFKVGTDPDEKKAREVVIKVMDPGKFFELIYNNELDQALKLVNEKTEKRVAYIRLRGMMPEDLEYFQNTISSDDIKDKEGLVLDLRANGGGRVHQQILDILYREIFGETRPRGGKSSKQPMVSWEKPVVVLIDQRSFSDAEVFAYGFKSMGRGQMVGIATHGGVIGTNDIQLSDGTTLRIPCVGWYTSDGKNLEGLGVEPDIQVKKTLYDEASDRDPQLDKAIEVILGEIGPKAEPVPEPGKDEKPKQD